MESAGTITKQESEILNEEVSANVDESTEACAATGETQEPTEEELRFCKGCDYQAPDWTKFVEHVLKPSHVKKFAEVMNVRVACDPVLMNITCEVCNITCSGHIPWNAHLMGEKHRKAKVEHAEKNAPGGGPIRNTGGKVQKPKPYDRPGDTGQQVQNVLFTQEHDFASYPEPLIGLEFVTLTELEGKGNMPWYECSVCDSKFDHNLKFAHLVGFKHRITVLKVKRPQEVKGLDASNKKRSDVIPILAEIAQKLENEEGRKEIKSVFPGHVVRGGRRGGRGSTGKTRGGTRGGTRGDTRGGTRGGRGNRGMPNTRGRGYNTRPYSNQQGQTGYDSYGSTFDNSKTYNSAYNANFDNPNNINYQPSYDRGQPQYSGVAASSYPGADQAYYGQSYPNTDPLYSSENRQSQRPEPNQNISSGLANALGDLTRLVQNEEDASVALNVSNALTQSLLKFRTTGQE